MKPYAHVGLPVARVVAQQFEPHIQHVRGPHAAGRSQPIAALHLLALHAVHGQGRALTGVRFFHGLAMHLHAAHAHFVAVRQQFQHVAGAHAAAPQRTGDHSAEAFHGEHAVYGKPRRALGPAVG